MSIVDQHAHNAADTAATGHPAPTPTPAPISSSAPLAPAPARGTGQPIVSQRAAIAVVGATILHQAFLVMTSASAADIEVAGYVVATSMFAQLAQMALIGAALFRPPWLPRALVFMMGIGLIAQAACPIDGHVSATNATFMLQTVSWLGYGALAVAVLGRSHLRADKGVTAS